MVCKIAAEKGCNSSTLILKVGYKPLFRKADGWHRAFDVRLNWVHNAYVVILVSVKLQHRGIVFHDRLVQVGGQCERKTIDSLSHVENPMTDNVN